MQALPSIQVTDLASSASFYSAITQPLGLRFVSLSWSFVVFGNPEPIFEVKVTPVYDGPPRPTRLVLSVGSLAAVAAFREAAERANPKGGSDFVGDGAVDNRASVADFDGNVVEVCYNQSFVKELRIIDWGLDVANSVGTKRSAASSGAQRNSQSLSDVSVLGPILGAVVAGAAVGAGLTYVFSRRERDHPLLQEYEDALPQRQSTCSDASTDNLTRYVESVEKDAYSEPSDLPPPPAYTPRNPTLESGSVEDISDDTTEDQSSSSYVRERGVYDPSGGAPPVVSFDAEDSESVSSIESPSLCSSRESPIRSTYTMENIRARMASVHINNNNNNARAHSPNQQKRRLTWSESIAQRQTPPPPQVSVRSPREQNSPIRPPPPRRRQGIPFPTPQQQQQQQQKRISWRDRFEQQRREYESRSTTTTTHRPDKTKPPYASARIPPPERPPWRPRETPSSSRNGCAADDSRWRWRPRHNSDDDRIPSPSASAMRLRLNDTSSLRDISPPALRVPARRLGGDIPRASLGVSGRSWRDMS